MDVARRLRLLAMRTRCQEPLAAQSGRPFRAVADGPEGPSSRISIPTKAILVVLAVLCAARHGRAEPPDIIHPLPPIDAATSLLPPAPADGPQARLASDPSGVPHAGGLAAARDASADYAQERFLSETFVHGHRGLSGRRRRPGHPRNGIVRRLCTASPDDGHARW